MSKPGPPSAFGCTCSITTAAAARGRSCVCPSTSPPGGLRPSETPQFILLTVGDHECSRCASTPCPSLAEGLLFRARPSRVNSALAGCHPTASSMTTPSPLLPLLPFVPFWVAEAARTAVLPSPLCSPWPGARVRAARCRHGFAALSMTCSGRMLPSDAGRSASRLSGPTACPARRQGKHAIRKGARPPLPTHPPVYRL